MDIRTYRARSMPQALDLVRRELGPTATVLHTRELNRGLLRRAMFGRQYEVAATAEGSQPSRVLPSRRTASDVSSELHDDRGLGCVLRPVETSGLLCGGPIQLRGGQARFVALVGPTGVGKTTTIAKLAANFRLRDEKQIGLITVDAYRIAAVEQLRIYAEIIDLPLEVVNSPQEMRSAVERMRDLDLVLIDTAGRSPRDEVRIRELRTVLAEAQPHEVHLVLSAASSQRHLSLSIEQFAAAGVTSLLFTKLDEAAEFDNLVEVALRSQLPLSYVTNGQDVPDDIAVADERLLADFGMQPAPSLAA